MFLLGTQMQPQLQQDFWLRYTAQQVLSMQAKDLAEPSMLRCTLPRWLCSPPIRTRFSLSTYKQREHACILICCCISVFPGHVGRQYDHSGHWDLKPCTYMSPSGDSSLSCSAELHCSSASAYLCCRYACWAALSLALKGAIVISDGTNVGRLAKRRRSSTCMIGQSRPLLVNVRMLCCEL